MDFSSIKAETSPYFFAKLSLSLIVSLFLSSYVLKSARALNPARSLAAKFR